MLHWFEWQKKKIHLFDITFHNHKIYDLNIDNIASYSRSGITDDGKIFLIGGQ